MSGGKAKAVRMQGWTSSSVGHGTETQANLIVDGRFASDAKRLDKGQMARLYAPAPQSEHSSRRRAMQGRCPSIYETRRSLRTIYPVIGDGLRSCIESADDVCDKLLVRFLLRDFLDNLHVCLDDDGNDEVEPVGV